MKNYYFPLIWLLFSANISCIQFVDIQNELFEKFESAIKKIDYRLLFNLAFENSSFFWARLKPNALQEIKKMWKFKIEI